MAILDLQLQWHWVWVLHMVISCNVMVLKREMCTREFRHWSTTAVRFMTASTIPLQLILVAQLCIYIPSPLMIDHLCIKEPDTPQICSQMPSLLPLNILLELWPPLLIFQISFLLMILILSMLWIKMIPKSAGWKEDTVVGNMAVKYSTKRQGSIAPHDLMKTRYFIIVMGLTG